VAQLTKFEGLKRAGPRCSLAQCIAPAQVWNWHIAAQGWRCLMSAAGESGQWAVEGECRLCPVADLGGVGIPQRSKPLTESIRRTKSDGTVATVHSALMFASRMMATETLAGRLVIPLSTGIIGSFADNRSRIG